MKIPMRYHLTLVRMAVIRKTRGKYWRGCGKSGALVHCWSECKLVQPLWKTVWSFLKKLKIRPWWDSSVGYNIVPICQGCGFDSQSGHIQETTNECTHKWNNKSISSSPSPSLSFSLSLSQINKQILM